MTYKQALDSIVAAILYRIAEGNNDSEVYEKFYIGKTAKFSQRWNEHHNDSRFSDESLPDAKYFNEMYKLAEGTPETINQLEIDVIHHFQGEDKMCNEIEGGSGNPEANVLYVLFHMAFVGDDRNAIHSIGNDESPIADGFPLNLTESDVQPKLYE